MGVLRRLGMANFSYQVPGVENATVQVLARSANAIAVLVGATNAFMVFKSTGLVVGRDEDVIDATGNTFVEYSWLSSGGTITNGFDNTLYDIRYVRTSGSQTTLSGGMANNTWYNLNTDRTMFLADTVTDGIAFTLTATVAIKYNANSTIISSATCSWLSSRENI